MDGVGSRRPARQPPWMAPVTLREQARGIHPDPTRSAGADAEFRARFDHGVASGYSALTGCRRKRPPQVARTARASETSPAHGCVQHGGTEGLMSIYERLGQENGIRTAVDDFYQRVLADPALAGYFDGVDMRKLRGHQTALL